MYTHTSIFIGRSMIILMNALSLSHYALPVSTTTPTTLVLRQSGSYNVVTRSLPHSLAATLLLRKF